MRRASLGLGRALPVSLLAVAALGVQACDAEPAFDRRAMLESLVDTVVLPQHRDQAAEGAGLASALEAYCGEPDEAGLAEARAAWGRTRAAWLRTEAHGLGPVMDERIAGELDFRPTRPATVEANVLEAGVDDASVDALGVAGKGLPALEYLLFPPEGDALDRLTGRRCAYAAALAHHVSRRSARLVEAWSPAGDDYRAALTTAGDGSVVYESQHAAVGALVNTLFSVLEDLKLARLGGPLGLGEAEADPEAVESPYAGGSIAGILATLEGAIAVWTGDYGGVDGVGLGDYVAAFDPALSARFGRELQEVVDLLYGVEPPLADRIREGDVSDAELAYEALRAAERTLGSDVAMTLSITVAFTDNDGD